MENKSLKVILRLENMLGIFRNYHTFSKSMQLVTAMIIGIEMLFHVFLLTCTVLIDPQIFLSILNAFHGVFTYTIMLSACYYSKRFENILKRIREVKESLKCDNVVNNFSNLVVFLSILMSLVTYPMKYMSYSSLHPIILLFINEEVILLFFRELFFLRFVVQNALIINLMDVLRDQVECVTRGCTRVDDDDECEGPVSVVSVEGISATPFEQKDYLNAYKNIRECCQQINKIFGVQFVLLIVYECLYFVIFLYKITYNLITIFSWSALSLWVVVLRFVLYFLSLLCLSWSAQCLYNSVDELQRTLGRNMIDFVLSDKRSYEEAKAFSRYITNNPVRVSGLGVVDVDMSLIPKMIMFIASYTVLVLQYNNVI